MRAVQVLLALAASVGLIGLVGCGETSTPDDGEETASVAQALDSSDISDEVATTQDQRDIAYRVVGSGDRDVVLVHGWMLSGVVYDNLIDELASDDYRLIIPDLRGTGGSDKPNGGYSLENYLKDIDAVLDDADATDYILVGHSMGGAIAQRHAAKNAGDAAGLVLMSPVPASGFPLPEEDYQFFKAAADDPELKRIILMISSVDLDPDDLEALAEAADEIPPKAIEQSLDAWVDADFADMLSQIEAPTEVLVSDDPFMPVPFLQAFVADPIPTATDVTYFPGGGHYLQVEEPAQTAAAIDDFVDDLD